MRVPERVLNVLTVVTATCALLVATLVVKQQLAIEQDARAVQARPNRTNRVVAGSSELIAAGRRMGPDTALLTILYFGDFECSACKQFADMLSAYLAKHTEDVGVVFRHFPLQYHRFAYPSARAAECAADQGRFEAMYRILYAKQDSLGLLTFHELARRASVPDRVRFANCFSESSPVERVERDRAAGTAAQIPGTPGVVIDGVLYAARLPNESVLDSLLAVARTRRR